MQKAVNRKETYEKPVHTVENNSRKENIIQGKEGEKLDKRKMEKFFRSFKNSLILV